MKKKLIILFLLLSSVIFSQEKFSKEFSILSDNDLYVSLYNDRYYTNALFLSYKYLSAKKSEKLHKKIIEWQIGHEMYSPYKAVVSNVFLHDRPFAAYLYGSFSYDLVYKNHQNLKTEIQLGLIGKHAFGRELQNFVHDIYGFERAVGWDFQIKDALALNFNADYINHIGMNSTEYVDFNVIGKARVGTVYTDLAVGFVSRFGLIKLTDIANSIAFRTNINDGNTDFSRELEAFVYVKPMVHGVLYDATLQGSFLNTGSPVTKNPYAVKFELEVGLQFTLNRVNFGYIINYQTNKTDNLNFNTGNTFGRISLAYLIR